MAVFWSLTGVTTVKKKQRTILLPISFFLFFPRLFSSSSIRILFSFRNRNGGGIYVRSDRDDSQIPFAVGFFVVVVELDPIDAETSDAVVVGWYRCAGPAKLYTIIHLTTSGQQLSFFFLFKFKVECFCFYLSARRMPATRPQTKQSRKRTNEISSKK